MLRGRHASRHFALAITLGAAIFGAACQRPPRAADSTIADSARGSAGVSSTLPAALIGPTWSLTELGGKPAPLGAGDRPATLVFDGATETRAAGFAGCNRWSSAFTHTPPSGIQFTAPLSTKMACADGMELEQRFLGFITDVREYTLGDSILVLKAADGTEGRFVRLP